MDRIYPRCCGMDVHKDSVWVCIRIDGRSSVEKFGTNSRELLRLGDRLEEAGVEIAAMEATGVYWEPVWNLLEDRLKLMLVNARHIKQVPGRKTDVKDCQWIAELLEHGLLKPSFVPPPPQRDLRDLTRQRKQLLNDRARVVNRVHKTLETCNIKLGSVASDITGKSGRAILDALVKGELSPEQMAELVHKRMEDKKPALREALAGHVTAHHRFMLQTLLKQIDHLDETVESFDKRIEEVMSPLELEAVKRLDAIPGFDKRTAQCVLAEIGTDMSRFPSDRHLSSWAGICPGNNQSGGKQRNGRTRHANVWLKSALTQAAWGASRTRRSYFAAQHRRLTTRRGAKRASIAVAHSLLVTVYHLLKENKTFIDLGKDFFDKHDGLDHKARKMLKQLEKMGYKVEATKRAA